MKLTDLTLTETKDKLKKKEISSQELVNACYAQIEKHDSNIQAFLTLNKEAAVEKAKQIDQKGTYEGLLEGIPIAVKDIICTKNIKTTAGSKILKNFIPPYNATVINKIEESGAIILGKTNQDEFAMGGSGENSGYAPTKNPWDISRIPGGSSSGSSACVAARMAPLALGTDTGGSIRQPASCCGIVGLKPTYGRVSRFGVMALASSLDQVGPLGRTVRDICLLLEVIAGQDRYDATTLPAEIPPYSNNLNKDIKGLRVGIPKEYFEQGGLGKEEEKVIQESIHLLERQGATVQEISLPHTKYAVAVYYLVLPAEASTNLARYDGIRYCDTQDEKTQNLEDIYVSTKTSGFGPEVKRRIMLGTFALSAGYQDQYYLKAQKVRTCIRQDFQKAFEHVDIIATPAVPTTAWKLGEKINDPLKMYLADVYTIPANLAGICGLSVPVGLANSLPVGLQLLGNQLEEQKILNAAYALEQEIQFYKQTPPFIQ